MLYRFGEHQPEIHLTAFVAPTACVIGRVKIGAYSSIWYNATIRGDINDIVIGEYSNIQDNCVLHISGPDHGGVPLKIGSRVTVGHSAILHSCEVKDGALIGMGACVLDRAVIGEDSLIGAKALVSEGKVIPPRSLVLGMPARVVRELTEDEIHRLKDSALSYYHLAELFKLEK
ncbi:MAG: gamma carbonic anhydrase family protein [Candidatus Wallbacteria bacterium]|nr:gamma carbonic anhydrase family protein [Candidatus Wallbacteria bacterium]